jgi:hemoglobin
MIEIKQGGAPGVPEGRSLYDRIGGHTGIAELLRHFYADVRQHAVLGPLFNARIQNWPEHLEKIGEFWALQAGGPSRYRGGFGAAHLPLDLKPEHFQMWLGLWEFNNSRRLPPTEAADMNQLAHSFARRLFALTQGRPRDPGK